MSKRPFLIYFSKNKLYNSNYMSFESKENIDVRVLFFFNLFFKFQKLIGYSRGRTVSINRIQKS